MSNQRVIALTAGDVGGIGPEILIRSLCDQSVRNACHPLVICHPAILERAAKLCHSEHAPSVSEITYLPADPVALRDLILAAAADHRVVCFNPAGNDATKAAPGQVSAAAGEAAFQYLTSAIDLARSGLIDAIATAPLNKAALHAAGHDFPGHTEILAAQCSVDQFSMMLHLSEKRITPLRQLVRTSADAPSASAHGLSIAHVTLHTSVRSVPQKLTESGVVETTQLMHEFLTSIGCDRCAIAVCALNPHGGESGLFGDEESRIIEPAVRRLSNSLPNVTGPLPVDTLIRRAVAGEFDGVVAMYHDQGHIPMKLMGFDAAVNITLGLPIVRVSPTHGTAFDRAWNADTPADPAGMIESILMAARLCGDRRH